MTETLAPLWQHNKICIGCQKKRMLPPNSVYCGHCKLPDNTLTRAFRRHDLKHLSEIRLRQGLSQERLARLSGVSRISISKFESARGYASQASAKLLAAALMVSVDDLEG